MYTLRTFDHVNASNAIDIVKTSNKSEPIVQEFLKLSKKSNKIQTVWFNETLITYTIPKKLDSPELRQVIESINEGQ
jgi:hypothetical protein